MTLLVVINEFGIVIIICLLLRPFEVLSPISLMVKISPSTSKMSSTFTDCSKSKITPERISLNVCCNPKPTPTNKAAEPVKNILLCVGSIQILDILFRSGYLKNNDIIEFSEFKHEFKFRFFNS